MGEFANLTEDARQAIRGSEITLTATYVVEDTRFGEKKEFTDLSKAVAYRSCLIMGHLWGKVEREYASTQDELFECSRCETWRYD